MPQIRQVLEPFVRFDPNLLIELAPDQETVVRLQGRLPESVDPAKLAVQPTAMARQIIAKNKALFGNIDEKTALADGRTATDRFGMTHVVLEQKHGDATVIGAQVSAHFKPDGTLHLLNSSLTAKIDAPTKPTVMADKARAAAVADAGDGATSPAELIPKLVVASADYLHIAQPRQNFYLCWQIEVSQPKTKPPAAWVYFIDATDGRVLFRYSALIATGVGVYSGSGPLATEPAAPPPGYVLIDDQTSAAWATHPLVETKDWRDSKLGWDNNDKWGEAVASEKHERIEVDIQRYLSYVLSYYHLHFGYDGWNGSGGNMIAYAHYADPDNAYWDGMSKTILIGDGNQDPAGSGSYGPFCALDVLFHEFTHAVNLHYNIVQNYWGETGAVNEAIADSMACFGCLTHPADEPQPWAMMDRVALTVHPRSLKDPSRDAAGVVKYNATSNATKFASVLAGFYPDHYSIRYTGASDYAGVHCNCTIIGHAIYLMVNGGTHRLSGIAVTGIGTAPVEQMLHYVVSTPGLLTNASVFADFRRAMLESCQMLYPGDLQYLATVKTAFRAVGIGPDLYLRDTLADTGREPAPYLSCWSPDIINRTNKADAATLTQMANLANGALAQNIEKGQDNYVYFRLMNTGSAPASGTFHLYLSKISTFPDPTAWIDLGSFAFGSIPAGGYWHPANPDQCLVIPAATTNALGKIHCCFIGIVDSAEDPAPDRMQIHSVDEFHAFIQGSNNYAWHNCEIVDLAVDPVSPVLIRKAFELHGFGALPMPTDFEIDTTNLPPEAVIDVLLPKDTAAYLKFTDVQRATPRPERVAVGAIPKAIPAEQQKLIARPAGDFAVPTEKLMFTRDMLDDIKLDLVRPVRVTGSRITRLAGVRLKGAEVMNVDFVLRLPPGRGARNFHLAFRQMFQNVGIGQVNYDIRITPKA